MTITILHDTPMNNDLAVFAETLQSIVQRIKEWGTQHGYDEVSVCNVEVTSTTITFSAYLIDDYQRDGYRYHGNVLHYFDLDISKGEAEFSALKGRSEKSYPLRYEREINFMQTALARVKEAADKHGFVSIKGKAFAAELIEQWKQGANLLTHFKYEDDNA